jgi:hypothetical protein
MTSRISHTTIDSHNAYQQSVWWAQVLGMREDPQDPNEPADEECMIFSADGRTRLLFIEVPEGSPTSQKCDHDVGGVTISSTSDSEVNPG